MDPKILPGSGSGVNHGGSATLLSGVDTGFGGAGSKNILFKVKNILCPATLDIWPDLR